MLIWYNKETKRKHIFIHIPKNGGKYIREKINKNKKNKRIKGYWGVKKNFDIAHIPYMKRHKYIKDLSIRGLEEKYNYITYSRDPYDRLISAFFYKNREKSIDDFKKFCNEELENINFNTEYSNKIIHYYPQYLFICDKKMELININIRRIENPKKYNLKKYYDNDTVKKVNKIYNRDFKLLNYKMYNSII
tara:strand:- start:520 stop:1092 length:573 start_codon:yes stop_codon:yes gene_type:complete